eukprot:6203410-Pleurochrysis_carterae.AAC.2
MSVRPRGAVHAQHKLVRAPERACSRARQSAHARVRQHFVAFSSTAGRARSKRSSQMAWSTYIA